MANFCKAYLEEGGGGTLPQASCRDSTTAWVEERLQPWGGEGAFGAPYMESGR